MHRDTPYPGPQRSGASPFARDQRISPPSPAPQEQCTCPRSPPPPPQGQCSGFSRGTETPLHPGQQAGPARAMAENGGADRGWYRGCPYLLSSFTETTSPPSREEKKEMEKLWSW